VSHPEAIRWDVVDDKDVVLANGDEHDFGGWDEANDWRLHNAPTAHVVEVFA
jgi:hypothetical protein